MCGGVCELSTVVHLILVSKESNEDFDVMKKEFQSRDDLLLWDCLIYIS